MADFKKIIPSFACKGGRAIIIDNNEEYYSDQILKHCRYYSDNGADELFIFDKSESDEDHEHTIRLIKEISRTIDIPTIVGGYIKRFEDVKKYLYAGASSVFLDTNNQENIDLMKDASSRFGSNKIYAYISDRSMISHIEEFEQLGASLIIIDIPNITIEEISQFTQTKDSLLIICDEDIADTTTSYLKSPNVNGVILTVPDEKEGNCMHWKHELKASGITVDTFEASIKWEEFKLNSDGHIPVIIQDYKTSDVLMLAYMNEESFQATLKTGKMHYFSRSRQKLWLKGETSGHFQYVKSLTLDCDHDTILAKVSQVGSACHTGKQSCFHNPLVEKEYRNTNPLKVFEEVYQLILERKIHPKEGSYTNYLFDKGIDKILKKLGEEATEIIIAAKNPDPEEIKYEIADFLYHMMVLMADKDVSWEEITKELAQR